jgi:biopolymer transport protein TolQ
MNIPVLDMIVRSGWIARGILIILGIFSIMTWAIIFNRFAYLGKVKKGNKAFLRGYMSVVSLTDMDKMTKIQMESPLGAICKTGIAEFRRILKDAHDLTGVKDWSFFLQNQFSMATERINTKFSEVVRSLDQGVVILAIASSVAPFIGLLGTVWGIMNSFFEIGNQGSASLPVVAPGIAEALITTTIGLAVAIPAVLFYNYFVHRADRIESEMDEFKNLLFSHLKRDIFNTLYSGNKQPK